MSRKFVVIKGFKDLEDKNHIYNKGDFYPRESVELDEARANVLASSDNKQEQPLVVEVLTDDAVATIKKDARKEVEAELKAKEEKAKKDTKKKETKK